MFRPRHDDDYFTIGWWVPWVIGAIVLILVGRAVRPPANVDLPPLIEFPLLGPSLVAAKVNTHDDYHEGLLGLETLLAERPDLQAGFGTRESLNLAGLLQWAIQDNDSGAFRIAHLRTAYRLILVDLGAVPIPPRIAPSFSTTTTVAPTA